MFGILIVSESSCSNDNIRLWDLQSPHYDSEMDPQFSTGISDKSTTTAEKATKRQDPSSIADGWEPVHVPFTIIRGHHGGFVSQLLTHSEHQIMVSVSGSRGWEGTSTNQCLMYEIGV